MTDAIADLLAAADELTDPRRHVEVRCILCPQLRPGRDARHYRDPHACDGCRTHLGQILADINTAYGELPAHLERGVGLGQLVSGGDVEAPLPFREDVWDLLLPVRTQPVRDPREQVGYQSVATVLDSWIRDFMTVRNKREVGPDPTVGHMTVWLSNRVEWACADHPAVDEFAAHMNALLRAIRRYVGHPEPRPEPCIGVPCRRCDQKALARLADGSGDIECQNPACRTIYRPDEYTRWVGLLAAALERT